jgi:Uma2 family endonuclease
VRASRHAAPADIIVVIEIAASSIQYDREVKVPLYASAGISEYWPVDRADASAHVPHRSRRIPA